MIDNPKQPETISQYPQQTSDLSEGATATPEEFPQGEANREEKNQPAELENAVGQPDGQGMAALQQEIVDLKQQLEEQNQKAEALKNQYMRIAADFENFRKRADREKEALEQQVKRNTIGELLSVVDNFERARNQIKPANDGEMGIHKSYQGVYKNLVDSLKRIGVSAMRPEGGPFDPNFHEALLQEETEEYPEGTIIEQLERGYLLGDRVLRHAKVKVAAAKEPMVTSQEGSLEEQGNTNPADN